MPQEVTAQISEATGHLPGVAIAIMGCIVNGPGEMADADFGWAPQPLVSAPRHQQSRIRAWAKRGNSDNK